MDKRFVANFGDGDKTVNFSITDRPEGYQPVNSFSGLALGNHTHTFSGAASAGVEVANGTDLSALTQIEFEVYGY